MTPRERYKTAVEAMAEAAWNNDPSHTPVPWCFPSHTPVPWCLAKDRRKDAYRRDARQQLDALLSALPALGLKIVPIEADEAMAEAWAGASIDTASAGLPDNEVNMLHAQSDWSAMLAAAPDPLGSGK